MRQYQVPEPRSHFDWCQALGLACQGTGCNTEQILTYDEFCFLPETTLTKISEGPLYGFWQKYGDELSEARTVKEWLDDWGVEIVEPVTEQDTKALNLFFGYDDFMNWAGGKVDFSPENNDPTLFQIIKNIFTSK